MLECLLQSSHGSKYVFTAPLRPLFRLIPALEPLGGGPTNVRVEGQECRAFKCMAAAFSQDEQFLPRKSKRKHHLNTIRSKGKMARDLTSTLPPPGGDADTVVHSPFLRLGQTSTGRSESSP